MAHHQFLLLLVFFFTPALSSAQLSCEFSLYLYSTPNCTGSVVISTALSSSSGQCSTFFWDSSMNSILPNCAHNFTTIYFGVGSCNASQADETYNGTAGDCINLKDVKSSLYLALGSASLAASWLSILTSTVLGVMW